MGDAGQPEKRRGSRADTKSLASGSLSAHELNACVFCASMRVYGEIAPGPVAVLSARALRSLIVHS